MVDLYREFKANQQILSVLEASKALTEGIFDELPIVLIMLDHQAKILKMNRIGQRIFGMDEPSVLGKGIEHVMPGSSAQHIREYFHSSDSDYRFAFEDKLTVEGSPSYFFWQMCPVYADKSGSPMVHVLIGSDTTEARAALEKLVAFNKDMEVASVVQNLLLPRTREVDTDYYRLAGYYEPAATVGGDLWWQSEADEDRFLSIVADVMGHGVGSAMVTAVLGGTIETLVSQSIKHGATDDAELLKNLDSIITKICRDTHAISLCSVSFDKKDDSANIHCFGFPPPLLLRKDQPRKSVVIRGAPIGFQDFFEPGSKVVPFTSGDRLICVTDGCYEFKVEGNRPLGRAALFKMFDERRDMTPSDVCEDVSHELKRLRGVEFAEDDITFVVIDRK